MRIQRGKHRQWPLRLSTVPDNLWWRKSVKRAECLQGEIGGLLELSPMIEEHMATEESVTDDLAICLLPSRATREEHESDTDQSSRQSPMV
ncbi:hypothetical protein DCS_08220 [Drechmeria coniospora]|uniref:Uncharacterized protein n=1 Tax=Drechmeria coniospora TaxID=98403 RepID=A0A151GGL7_DRECN|nr:hypothetical protein DCS_08220 [Drechmeria coniospora]KYK56250.1 hypothetical protein DCS_08220 [Drechmeria coniospora]